MRSTHPRSHFTQQTECYLISPFSWLSYASKSLVFLANNACCFPPRPPRVIAVLSSSNRLQRMICGSLFALLSFSSTPMTREERTVPRYRNSVGSYTLFCFPPTRSSTPDLFGSTLAWAFLAVMQNIVCLFFLKRPPLLLLPPTPNRNPITSITL